MTRLKLLPLLLVTIFCSLSYAGPNPRCPEYCKCQHTAMYVTNMECTKISRTQYFADPIIGFTLEKDVDENALPLELTKKFFLELGRNFIHIDTMLITADIAKIDRDAFQGLYSLSNLNISNNGLTYIHPDTFANNKALTHLALTRNPIKFGDNFLNSNQLSELDLSFCEIRNLPENAFIGLTELEYLNLESNLIDTIHPKAFEPLLGLEELNLAHNNLRIISPDTFMKNEELNVLRLDYNPLPSIENLNLPAVDELYLQHCNFTELTTTTFSSYPLISHLNLSGNSIEKVSPDAFSKLSSLLYLDISNNKLGPLNSSLFSANILLEILNLRDNPTMSFWPEEGFQGAFQQFHYLDLSNTGIQSLALGSLKNMTSLTQLHLSRNAFEGFEKGVLPQSIIYLSLAHNKITSIDDINLSNEHQVRQLFLQGNKIKNLTRHNFENLPNLSKLDVSSCEIESILFGGKSGEQKFRNLQQLNLAKNKLQKILPTDLNVFNNLDMLDIRDNPFVCNDDLLILRNYLQNSSIEPVGSSNIGNIDRSFEKYDWDDIVPENCDLLPKSTQKLSEAIIPDNNEPEPLKPVPEKPDPPPKINNLSTDEHKFPVGDMYEDIISDDNNDYEYDQDDYETTKFTHHKSVLTPQIVQVSETSPVVVAFLSALLMTVLITLALALLTAICKQKFVKPHKGRCSSYRPLAENEHMNSPTTPIVKKRVQLSEIEIQGKQDSYIRAENDGTYSSTDFHHSNITPQTI